MSITTYEVIINCISVSTYEVLKCLPDTSQSPWSIPSTEFSYRKDFRPQCVFTIDPATARDLDDAVSVEELGDGESNWWAKT